MYRNYIDEEMSNMATTLVWAWNFDSNEIGRLQYLCFVIVAYISAQYHLSTSHGKLWSDFTTRLFAVYWHSGDNCAWETDIHEVTKSSSIEHNLQWRGHVIRMKNGSITWVGHNKAYICFTITANIAELFSQQDGAPLYNALAVRDYLNQTIPQGWFGSNRSIK